MSDEQTPQPIESLHELVLQHAQLTEELREAPSRLAGAFGVALSTVTERIHTEATTASVLEIKVSLEAQRSADVDQVSSLFQRGLLNETQRDDMLSEILRHEDYKPLRTIGIAERILGQTLETSTVQTFTTEQEVETTESTEAEDTTNLDTPLDTLEINEVPAEQMPAELTIISFEDGSKHLKVGRSRGKRVPLSLKKNSNQKDYTEERAIFLQAIIDAGGEEVTIGELRRRLEAVGLDSNRETTRQVKEWLDSITFYGKNVFTHNGKRGPSSSYSTNPEFSVSLNFKEAKTSKETTTTANPKMDSQELSLSTSIDKGLIPLRETNVFASILSDNSELLSALGIPAPKPDVVAEIDTASNLEDLKQGVIRQSTSLEQIKNERKRVALQFKAIMTDSDAFDIFADSLTEQDIIYPFIEYLMELEPEQWDLVIYQVLESRIVSTTLTNPERDIIGTFDVISLPDGRVFERRALDDGTRTFGEIDLRRGVSDAIEDSDIVLSGISRATNEASVQVDSKTSEWEQEFSDQAKSEVVRLKRIGGLFEGYKSVAQAIAMSKTEISAKKFVEELLKAGLIERQSGNNGYPTWEVSSVHVVMHKLLKTSPRLAGQGSKKDQKTATATVEKWVADILETLE